MKITFLLDRLNLGGAERHSLNLANALTKIGYDVSIIVLFSGGSENFPIKDFPKPPIMLNAKSILSVSLFRNLIHAFNEISPDFVFAINQTALVSATIARALGANIRRLACRFATTKISSRIGQAKFPIFKFCAAKADTLIFVSYRQREYWEKRGLRSKRVVTVQNGIAENRFSPATLTQRVEKRAQYGFTDNDVVVTIVGRLAPEKNHEWLFQNLHQLYVKAPSEAEHLKLLIIGEGPEQQRLEKITESLGLSKRVCFAGGKKDVAPELAAADVGILVSNAIETFSHAALELMCAGLPMIMTDIGGASEIVVDGESGFLINLDDDPKLQTSLLKLCDPMMRQKMGTGARNRVLQYFTYSRMLKNYVKVIENHNIP